METTELMEIISRGEDSKHQFKANVTNEISLAQEMVAKNSLVENWNPIPCCAYDFWILLSQKVDYLNNTG